MTAPRGVVSVRASMLSSLIDLQPLCRKQVYGFFMISDLASGQSLSAQQLVERLAAASHVLVGVQHDNPDHLAVPLWLLQSLVDRRAQGSFLLAMLSASQQGTISAVQSAAACGQPPEDLPAALDWQSQWDWAFYGPLLRYALVQPYPLLAANLSADEAQAIALRPQRLSGTHSTTAAVRHRLLEQFNPRDPEAARQSLLAVHQQRDRRMARELLAAPAPALLLAGAEHVRKDLGVPLHMTDLLGNVAPVVLILAPDSVTIEPQSADYVWYTATA